MSPLNPILAATDFSPWSLQSLVRRTAPHAHLTLLTMFQVPLKEMPYFAGVCAAIVEVYQQKARAKTSQRIRTEGSTDRPISTVNEA